MEEDIIINPHFTDKVGKAQTANYLLQCHRAGQQQRHDLKPDQSTLYSATLSMYLDETVLNTRKIREKQDTVPL